MKSIVESIHQINEGLCKNLYKIRKGHQVYVIGETGTKAQLVKVKEVIKKPWSSRYSTNDISIEIILEENPYITWLHILDNKDNTDELYATFCNFSGRAYVGVSKEAIQALRSSHNKSKVEEYAKEIEEVQKKLNGLITKKQEFEETISSEISESYK